MKPIFPLALVGALCAVSSVVQACSCMAPPAPKIALEKSDAVFVGKPTKIASSGFSNTFQFAVGKKWKGVEGDTVTVVSATESAACGINFDVEREYLVYAYKSKGSEQLQTNLCTRTKRAADATEDLAELGEPTGAATKVVTDQTATETATEYPVRNGVVQVNAEITRDPLVPFVQAIRANKTARQFRVNWNAPTGLSFNGTALYNRPDKTLKVYSLAETEKQIRIESVLYSGVTDNVLAKLADTEGVQEFFKTYANYGVTRRDLGSKTVRVTE